MSHMNNLRENLFAPNRSAWIGSSVFGKNSHRSLSQGYPAVTDCTTHYHWYALRSGFRVRSAACCLMPRIAGSGP